MDGESWAVGRREAPICDASDWRSHGLTGEKLDSRRLVGYFQGQKQRAEKKGGPKRPLPFPRAMHAVGSGRLFSASCPSVFAGLERAGRAGFVSRRVKLFPILRF